MGLRSKINWARIRKRFTQLLLIVAIVVACISTIALTSDADHEPSILFLVPATMLLGYFFGNYVSRIFLKQSRTYQTKILVLLPILAFISILLLVSLVSHSSHSRELSPFEIFFVIITTILFSFSLGLFASLLYQKLRQQITAAETAAAHSKSELQLLQSQLSPHFLFNTLNNLYGISLSEPDKTPGMLLRLSELLRYSVYDAKDAFVALKDELNYLKNYIEFEKIRIGDRLDLKVDIENFNTENISIAPMLLVVFVENAFKHAKNNLNDKMQIEISMKLWIDQVLFAVKNSYSDMGAADGTGKHSGFGLQSTIKRLQLLYPNSHDLKIEKTENAFSVMLRVNIKRLSKK
jgi:sensor histidine kinase YesM